LEGVKMAQNLARMLAKIKFDTRLLEQPRPKKLLIIPPHGEIGTTVAVLWGDGIRTEVSLKKDDIFDIKVGFALCLLKKMYTRKQYEKILSKAHLVGIAKDKTK
jgi:hypothetical protein